MSQLPPRGASQHHFFFGRGGRSLLPGTNSANSPERDQDGSPGLRGRVGRLRKSDAHYPESFFASDRQIGDEEKLVAAFLHVSLQSVFCSPGLFHDDHRNGG